MSADALIARATVAAVAGCGLLDTSPWAIAAGVLVLTSQRAEACLGFADKYGAALGHLEAGSLFVAAAAARNTVVCAVAYTASQVLRLCT
jgi:hypothetical protein